MPRQSTRTEHPCQEKCFSAKTAKVVARSQRKFSLAGRRWVTDCSGSARDTLWPERAGIDRAFGGQPLNCCDVKVSVVKQSGVKEFNESCVGME